MKIRSIIVFTVIGFIVFNIILMNIPTLKFLKDTLAQSLLGSADGAFAGAFIIYIFQTKLEQIRYFQTVLDNGQKIVAGNTAWIKKNSKWENVEFRHALGMAKWSRDPRDHRNLHIDIDNDEYKGIDWKGVAYSIDDDYCVASKALHEYTSWIDGILAADKFGLLSKKHILLMWRMIADAMYPRDSSPTKATGMRKWLEFFLLGNYIEKEAGIEKVDKGIDKSTYNDYLKFRNMVEKYEPVKNAYQAKDKEFK